MTFLPKQIQKQFWNRPSQKADNNCTLDKKKGKTSKSGSYEDQKSGEYSCTQKEMEKVNTDRWLKKCKYENLLTLVAPQITKSLVKREAVSPGERLPVTCSFTEQVSFVVSELLPTPVPVGKKKVDIFGS